jgi:hypothetical protein
VNIKNKATNFLSIRYIGQTINFIKITILFKIWSSEDFGLYGSLLAFNELGIHFLFGTRLYFLNNHKTNTTVAKDQFLAANRVLFRYCVCASTILCSLYYPTLLTVSLGIICLIGNYAKSGLNAYWNATNKTTKISLVDLLCQVVSLLYLYLNYLYYETIKFEYGIFIVLLSPLLHLFYFIRLLYFSKTNFTKKISLSFFFPYYKAEITASLPLTMLRILFPVNYGYQSNATFSIGYSIVNNISYLVGGNLYFYAKKIADKFKGQTIEYATFNQILQNTRTLQVKLIGNLLLIIIFLTCFNVILNKDVPYKQTIFIFSIFYYRYSSVYFKTYMAKHKTNSYANLAGASITIICFSLFVSKLMGFSINSNSFLLCFGGVYFLIGNLCNLYITYTHRFTKFDYIVIECSILLMYLIYV